MRKREWPQQHGVEHAEHRGVEPDAESERDDGDRGEARLLAETADGETQILQTLFEADKAALIAALLLHLSEAAEFALGGVMRLIWRYPVRDLFLHPPFEM